jgi:hypothetical protein
MAAVTAALSVTSRGSGKIASPWAAARPDREPVSRAVAATLSPRDSAASANRRPKPREEPVMNQVLLMEAPLARWYEVNMRNYISL